MERCNQVVIYGRWCFLQVRQRWNLGYSYIDHFIRNCTRFLEDETGPSDPKITITIRQSRQLKLSYKDFVIIYFIFSIFSRPHAVE
ncbi:hypothetical protein AR158_c247L [Paramecium bursaria Chlorella virus AR158]|uniref:hypothetical protein n=1 Tax=Paramecium bursaria Chlorella virus AR158 TaxID=380598 RepID=UPI00015AA8AB|nr:hypothetical protein AR158_c247L [Paramecium bursaria Chlorella virus AR158]ABU43792.1 hypothetical protein AR158_c247L [Paramecium bursaria Chlorella virus AR158]